MTKEEILKKHLDKHNIEITKVYVKYLYDAMEEYASHVNKSPTEEIRLLKEENEKLKQDYEVLATKNIYHGQSVKHWFSVAQSFGHTISELTSELNSLRANPKPCGDCTCIGGCARMSDNPSQE